MPPSFVYSVSAKTNTPTMAAAKLYNPDSPTPFALSRSKVELVMDCPRCFYLDRRLGIARPAGFPFNLNSAVDSLLKREFDRYRAEGAAHPLMTAASINAVPHAHPDLDTWRNNSRGVRSLHAPTKLEFYDAIGDRPKPRLSPQRLTAASPPAAA
jgi:hypothetical protein